MRVAVKGTRVHLITEPATQSGLLNASTHGHYGHRRMAHSWGGEGRFSRTHLDYQSCAVSPLSPDLHTYKYKHVVGGAGEGAGHLCIFPVVRTKGNLESSCVV